MRILWLSHCNQFYAFSHLRLHQKEYAKREGCKNFQHYLIKLSNTKVIQSSNYLTGFQWPFPTFQLNCVILETCQCPQQVVSLTIQAMLYKAEQIQACCSWRVWCNCLLRRVCTIRAAVVILLSYQSTFCFNTSFKWANVLRSNTSF